MEVDEGGRVPGKADELPLPRAHLPQPRALLPRPPRAAVGTRRGVPLERSGVLHGLLRARGFTQDDSHTFCRRDQVGDGARPAPRLRPHMAAPFRVRGVRGGPLHPRPGQGDGRRRALGRGDRRPARLLDAGGVPYRVAEGEAAFYGPKIDVHVKDAIGRRWQMSTIQLDFFFPERFDLEYATSDNRQERAGDDPLCQGGLVGEVRRRAGRALRGGFPDVVGTGAGDSGPGGRPTSWSTP